MTEQRKPLWLLMQDAVINAPPPLRSPAGSIAAAQLRAIAAAAPTALKEMDPRDIAAAVAWLNFEADRAEQPEDSPECYSPGRIKTPVEMAENCCESCPFLDPCYAGREVTT